MGERKGNQGKQRTQYGMKRFTKYDWKSRNGRRYKNMTGIEKAKRKYEEALNRAQQLEIREFYRKMGEETNL